MFPYNSTGIDPEAKNFTPAPEGEYWLVVKEASDIKDMGPRITRNGDPYVMVTCEVDEGPYLGKMVWHNVTFMKAGAPGAGMAVKFLKTIGEPWDGEIDINPAIWIGRRFRAKLKIGKDNQGRPKNEIAYLLEPEISSPVAQPNSMSDDEVPF